MSTFAVLRIDDVQRAAQEALDLLLAAGLGLEAYEQRSGDHASISTTPARADKTGAACVRRESATRLLRWKPSPSRRRSTSCPSREVVRRADGRTRRGMDDAEFLDRSAAARAQTGAGGSTAGAIRVTWFPVDERHHAVGAAS
jgi:hypothetical protein